MQDSFIELLSNNKIKKVRHFDVTDRLQNAVKILGQNLKKTFGDKRRKA